MVGRREEGAAKVLKTEPQPGGEEKIIKPPINRVVLIEHIASSPSTITTQQTSVFQFRILFDAVFDPKLASVLLGAALGVSWELLGSSWDPLGIP